MSGLVDDGGSSAHRPSPSLVPREPQSLVKEVASLSVDSADSPIGASGASNGASKGISLPFGSQGISDWLAQADPQIFAFDEAVWQAKTAQFVAAQAQAQQGAALAEQKKAEADSLVTEAAWLLHELHDAAEHDLLPLNQVLDRQREYETRKQLADEVQRYLEVGWLAHERIERVLRGPAPKAVPQIPQMMEDIDAGIAFCEQHLDFVGAQASLEQWRRSSVRTLGIAGAYVQHELRKIAHQVQEQLHSQLQTQPQSQTSSNVLLYAKFRSSAQRLRPMISLVRARADTGNVWLDLQRTYCDLRTPLVSPDAQRYADGLNPLSEFSDEFVDAARTAIVKTRKLCSSEQQLFRALFGEPTPTFNTWLGDVALPLYAAVRKLLVHETDISKLCQIVVLVSSGTGERNQGGADISDNTSVVGSAGGSLVTSLHHSLHPSVYPGARSMRGARSTFGDRSMAGTALGDRSVAGRSISPTEVVPNETTGEQSTEEQEPEEPEGPTGDPVRDLLAPAAQSRLVFRAHLVVEDLANFQPTNKDFLRSKFPTVDTAITLLSQVYQLLAPNVFNELAHKCVRGVLQSLDIAVANKMASSGAPDIEIHLFHIKQLLILQSQIADFDIHNSVVHEVDFSGIQRLLQVASGRVPGLGQPAGDVNGGETNPGRRSFRELLALAWDSIPRVVDIMVDAMEEIFASLRRAVDRLCIAFLQLTFKVPFNADNMAELRGNITTQFGELRQAIAKYTNDVEFTHFLLDSVQEAVMDRYTVEFRKLSPEEQHNENVMDIDTMVTWVSSAVTDA